MVVWLFLALALAPVNRISVEPPVDLYKISVAHYMLSQENKMLFLPGSGDSGDTAMW